MSERELILLGHLRMIAVPENFDTIEEIRAYAADCVESSAEICEPKCNWQWDDLVRTICGHDKQKKSCPLR